MTDKEFKKLTRTDLISIIYEMQKSEEKLAAELEETKKALASKEMKYANAGNLAEALVGVNELVERTQKAADEYLAQVKESSRQSQEIIDQANKEAEAIRSAAQKEAEAMIDQAGKEVAARWEDFDMKVTYVLQAHKELEDILKGNRR